MIRMPVWSGEGPLLVIDVSLYPHMGALCDLFCKSTNPIHGDSPPHGSHLLHHLWGLGFQHMSFEGVQTFRP